LLNLWWSSITDAVEAFNKSDVTLAESVIVRDNQIDDAVVRARRARHCTILARQAHQSPKTSALSSVRIAHQLRRSSAWATWLSTLAQLARYRFPEKVVPKTIRPTFKEMGVTRHCHGQHAGGVAEERRHRLSQSLRRFVTRTTRWTRLHLSVFETVSSVTPGAQETETTVDATLASRYLERFADHAVSIAKKMVYLATGEWNPPKH
jgi:phosphate transport system protein